MKLLVGYFFLWSGKALLRLNRVLRLTQRRLINGAQWCLNTAARVMR